MEIHLDRFAAVDASARLLVLHGGGGYGRLFAPVGVAARRHGYEVLAPDLPGFGLTVVPKKRRLQYQDWIDCISDLLDEERRRDDRPIVLFGGSMGGMLAYEVAARTGAASGLAATCLLDTRDRAVRAALARFPVLTRWAMPAAGRAAWFVDPLRVPMRAVAKISRITPPTAMSCTIARTVTTTTSRLIPKAKRAATAAVTATRTATATATVTRSVTASAFGSLAATPAVIEFPHRSTIRVSIMCSPSHRLSR
jgi:pimeloyl-ACP methyl ester carboxylesterase